MRNYDFTNTKDVLTLLKISGVFKNNYRFECMQAYSEVYSFNEFLKRVATFGYEWDRHIIIYKNYTWKDYGNLLVNYIDQIPSNIVQFMDIESYAKHCCQNYIKEYSNGLLEIND